MSTWAVIKTGGKQYKVQEGAIIVIEKLSGPKNSQIFFDQVLVIGNEKMVLGHPFVEKASVKGKVLESFKEDKIKVVKFKPKSRYLRTYGHRQEKMRILIEKIQFNH